MIKLAFAIFVAVDVAALLFFFVLGLAAAGSTRTSPMQVALVMLGLPVLVLLVSIWVFLRASSPLWRMLAFAMAAAPLVVVVGTQAYNDARFHANSNAQGQLLFFTDGPQQQLADAIVRGDQSAVDSLLPRAQINATGMDDMTLLVLALRQLRTAPTEQEILRKLLAAGADPNAATPYERPLEMALQIDAKTGPAPVRLLLEAGADPNRLNSSGTPIFFAGAGNTTSLETLTLLLKHGANLRATGSNGESILIYAAMARNWRAARFLLEQGADPHVGRSFKGQSFADLVRDASREEPPIGGSGVEADTAALREVMALLRTP